MSITIPERIDQLVTLHGCLRGVARFLETDMAHLTRLHTGEERKPTKRILKKLGLREVITYELKDKP